MRVYLRRVQVLVAEQLLERSAVYAVLEHQRRGCVAQLVRGVFRAVQPGGEQMLFHEAVNRGFADPYAAAR